MSSIRRRDPRRGAALRRADDPRPQGAGAVRLRPAADAEADLRYLHETHGLPPELVTELLTEPGETSKARSGNNEVMATYERPG